MRSGSAAWPTGESGGATAAGGPEFAGHLRRALAKQRSALLDFKPASP